MARPHRSRALPAYRLWFWQGTPTSANLVLSGRIIAAHARVEGIAFRSHSKVTGVKTPSTCNTVIFPIPSE